MDKIVIGTRGSKLALWQAHWVKEELLILQPDLEIEIKVIKTEGDSRHDLAPGDFNKEGIFTAALDRALLQEEIDIAVHSLKDLPTRLSPGLVLAAVPERGAVTDTLILREDHARAVKKEAGLGQEISLPLLGRYMKGKVVGTSSLRRRALLKYYWPGVKFVPLRGNLDTRVRKLSAGEVDAVVVATAGLHRLAMPMGAHLYLALDYPWYLPAAGQGALALETRRKDRAREIAGQVNHGPTFMATAAERAAMSRLGAGCRVPAGFLGEIEEVTLKLKGVVASEEARSWSRQRWRGRTWSTRSWENGLPWSSLTTAPGSS